MERKANPNTSNTILLDRVAKAKAKRSLHPAAAHHPPHYSIPPRHPPAPSQESPQIPLPTRHPLFPNLLPPFLAKQMLPSFWVLLRLLAVRHPSDARTGRDAQFDKLAIAPTADVIAHRSTGPTGSQWRPHCRSSLAVPSLRKVLCGGLFGHHFGCLW
jgi:hypothetical protein